MGGEGAMRLTRRIFWGAVALAVGAPAVGALLRGVTALPLGLLALGALWSVVAERTRLAGAAFALCVGGIALGIWLGVGIGWLLVGMTAALAAWDLEAFNAWLVSIARVENERELVREHLRQLALVCGIGLSVALAASRLRVQLSFGVALFLALTAVLGLGYVLRGLGE